MRRQQLMAPLMTWVTAAVIAVAVTPAGARAQAVSPADEVKRLVAQNGVVTSANALASEAGVEVLRAGGNAVDAIVAATLAVGVTEPQMSGLGGSGAATVWMKREGKPDYLNFYAGQSADSWRGHTQPAAQFRPGGGAPGAAPGARGAPPAEEGQSTPELDLGVVGVPGAVAGLLALHEKYGALSRQQVMAPAIRLAEEGFPIGQILAGYIAGSEGAMQRYPEAMAVYFPGGKAPPPGTVIRNPDLAASLRRVAAEGRKGFYEGPTAQSIVALLNANKNPTTLADFGKFEPQWGRPLCTDYRGYTIFSAAPPQTGYQVLHTLELLEPFDLKALDLPTRSAAAFDVLASAMRGGQSVTRYNNDPNWAAVPANGLASEAFAASRRELVGTGKAAETFPSTDPTPFDKSAPAAACALYEPYGPATPIPGAGGDKDSAAFDAVGERAGEELGETTHLSAVDRDGNAAALTITNSSVWGSRAFVQGFFLNNSGFRFTDENINAPARSTWRVRNTTISPTIVMRNGEVQVVIGAPGGGRIPTEVLQVLVYMLDYGLDPLDAVRMPRIGTSAGSAQVQLEHGFTPDLLQKINAMGYEPVAETPGYARLYLIARRGNSWVGVADTRHDGQPRGY